MPPSRRCHGIRLRVLVSVVALVLVPVAALGKPGAKSGADAGARPDGTSRGGKVTRGTRVTIDSTDPDVVLEAQAPEAPAGAGAGEAEEGGGAAAETTDVPLPLDDGRWEVVCSPPCQRRLPRSALFRITGTGVTTSPAFSLPGKTSSVTLDVKTGTARWYWTGAIAAIAGATFIIGSVGPRLAIGGSFSTVEKVMAGAGLVLVGGGAPLWWFNRTTVAIF